MIKIICAIVSFSTCLNILNSQSPAVHKSEKADNSIFQEDFTYKVRLNDNTKNLSKEKQKELLDAGSIVYPISISEKTKEINSPLTLICNENTSGVLIDISNIYLISDHYDPENSVIIELSSENKDLKADFLYHGAMGFINFLSATSIEVRKPLQENLLIYIQDVPLSVSLHIYPKKASPVTSANIEIASIQKLNQSIPASTQLSDLDLCNISNINIFLDNSMSFENEQRVELIEYLTGLLNKQENNHPFKINFYSIYENTISEPVVIYDINQDGHQTENLSAKLDEIIRIEGKFLEWTELIKFTSDPSHLNILFTDGIPNGKNGSKIHSVAGIEDLISSKGFLFVNSRFQYDNSEYLKWYSLHRFKNEFSHFLNTPCPVTASNKSDLQVFPNPIKAGNYVSLKGEISPAADQILEVRILDLSGKIVQRDEFPVHSGTYEKSIFIGDISSGIYYIEIATRKNEIIQVAKLSVL